MIKRIFKSNAFKLLVILVLSAVSINPSSQWVVNYLDGAHRFRVYVLDLNETLFSVGYGKTANGSQRLSLNFIVVDNNFWLYSGCYFIGTELKRSTPGAVGFFTKLMYKDLFHKKEGVPIRIQSLIGKALRSQNKSKKASSV